MKGIKTKNQIIKVTNFYNIVTTLILLLVFYYIQLGASDYVIWPCLIIFYYHFVTSLKKPIYINPTIPTFLKIDILFMLFFYIIYYLPYQAYVLGIADISKSIFVSYTFVEYTNQSIVASTVGLIMFVSGYNHVFNTSARTIAKVPKTYIKDYKYLPRICVVFLLVLLGLFFNSGFSQMIDNSYSGSDTGNNTENGIYFLITHFVIILISMIIFYVSKKLKLPLSLKVSIVLSICWSILLLVFGDRNTFFIIAIIAGVGFFSFIKKIRTLWLILSIFTSVILYNVIEVSRQADERSIMAIYETLISNQYKVPSIEESSFSNSTVTARATFYLVPEKYDFFFGKFKLIGIAGIIPYSRSLFVDKNDPYTSSAEVLTEGIMNSWATWSIGSNIISDIYMDFGMVGICFLMYLMGYFAKYVQEKAIINNDSLKHFVIYLVVLSLYGEVSRYSFGFPVRNIVWAILLFVGYDLLVKRSKTE